MAVADSSTPPRSGYDNLSSELAPAAPLPASSRTPLTDEVYRMTRQNSSASTSSGSSGLAPAYPLITPAPRSRGTLADARTRYAGTIHHEFAPPTLDAYPGGMLSIDPGRATITPDLSAYPIKGTIRLIQTLNVMFHPRGDGVMEDKVEQTRRCGHPRHGKARHQHRRRPH